MTSNEYVSEVLKTESCDMEPLKDRLQDEKTIRLLHAAIGLSTESGEVLDMLKKHIYYGRKLDEVNFIEELGDLLWYVGVAVDALGTTFEEVQRINVMKLKERYDGEFSQEKALKRDLAAERRILEGKQ